MFRCVAAALVLVSLCFPQTGKMKDAKSPPLHDESGALTTADISEGRHLSEYEDGGHFDCRRFTKLWLKDREKAEMQVATSLSAARLFIWNHWQSKKRGYLRVTLNSVDATSTSHIFIEPDSHGDWQVSWRIVRQFGEVDDVPIIRTVERVENKQGYVLAFKSADGRQLETL